MSDFWLKFGKDDVDDVDELEVDQADEVVEVDEFDEVEETEQAVEAPVATPAAKTSSKSVTLVKGNPAGTSEEMDAVMLLQELLNGHNETLLIDGLFGPQTNAAVRRFQRRNKLEVNGVVDDEVWALLWG